jgi:hypothetical protein
MEGPMRSCQPTRYLLHFLDASHCLKGWQTLICIPDAEALAGAAALMWNHSVVEVVKGGAIIGTLTTNHRGQDTHPSPTNSRDFDDGAYCRGAGIGSSMKF